MIVGEEDIGVASLYLNDKNRHSRLHNADAVGRGLIAR